MESRLTRFTNGPKSNPKGGEGHMKEKETRKEVSTEYVKPELTTHAPLRNLTASCSEIGVTGCRD